MMTMDKTTGQMVKRVPSGWKSMWPDMQLRHDVVGLKAEDRATSLRFTFERAEEINEADAIDAQCRAGWNDAGYGFWGFMVYKTETGYAANWCCSKSCD